MGKSKVDLDAVVGEWLAAQAGFKRYVNATENLYAVFAEGWCDPRRGLPEAFADFRADAAKNGFTYFLEVFRAALLSDCDYKHLEVVTVFPRRRPDSE